MGDGKKSLALAVRIQPKDATLTEAEIEALAQKIVAAALKLGATLAELKMTARGFNAKSALAFVIVFGFVTLFADAAYEGIRVIACPFLATLGASGAAVGAIAGGGS